MRILKFGGTSVATVERRVTVARVVAGAAQEEEVVVVISALAGVTDLLSAAIEGRCGGDELITQLKARHSDGLPRDGGSAVSNQIERRLLKLAALLPRRSNPTVRHEILASGERLAVPLVLDALRQHGLAPRAIDGSELVVAHGGGAEPEIDLQATARRLQCRFHPAVPGRVTVVPGFVARDRRGQTTTLGRGASDLSATLLGALLGVSEVAIWTDVDGVLSASPQLVPEAAAIAHLSYGEASTLAHFGARVLHPLALAPLLGGAVPVRLRNTLHPLAAGTRIDENSAGVGVKGIAAMQGASRFRVRLPWGSRRSGRLLAELEELGVRPLLVASEVAAQALSLVVQGRDVGPTSSALGRFLGRGGQVEPCHDLAVVVAVGAGAENSVWVEQEVRDAVESEGIMALGLARQENAVAILVEENSGDRVVRVLHNRLIVLRRCRESARREAA